MFTVRYGLSPYSTQIRFVFKGLITHETARCHKLRGFLTGPKCCLQKIEFEAAIKCGAISALQLLCITNAVLRLRSFKKINHERVNICNIIVAAQQMINIRGSCV